MKRNEAADIVANIRELSGMAYNARQISTATKLPVRLVLTVLQTGVMPEPQPATTPWQQYSDDLNDWTMTNLVNRTDRCVVRNNGWISVADNFNARLRDHFADERQVVLYAVSETGTCKWCCLDFDNHDGLPDVAQRNMDVATGLLNTLTELGIVSILEDSDGRGGLHLWILFRSPIAADVAYRFAHWIVSDYPDDDIECNPKQRSLKSSQVGNGVRIPGRHHKRDHNSRLWVDGSWLDENESVELLLQSPVNDPGVTSLMGSFDPDPAPVTAAGFKPEFTTTFSGDSPICRAEQHIESSVTWPDLLTSHGWSPATHDGYEWIRPGKTSGTSATLNFADTNMLYVFTTETNLRARTSYGKWRFWCHVNGYGDRQYEAAQAYTAGTGH